MYSEEEFVKYVNDTFGVKLLYHVNKVYLIRVKSHEVCKKLFDRKDIDWCIAQSEKHWDEYITHPGNKQYFIVDFNHTHDLKGSAGYNNAFIGFTLNKEGEIYAAHARDDKNLLHYDYFTGVRDFEKILKEKSLYNFVIENKMRGEEEAYAMVPVYFLVGSILLAMCSLLIKF